MSNDFRGTMETVLITVVQHQQHSIWLLWTGAHTW